MKKRLLLSLLVLLAMTGCGLKMGIKESENDLIKIKDNDKGYVTTFKTINNIFIQTQPQYNHVDSDKWGIFISFQYIESSKETYDYAKTHNFLGHEYHKGDIKEYKWNNYEGYFFDVDENEMYFRILLEDDKDNSIVLSGFVGPKVDSKNKNEDLTKLVDNEEFQKFLNSIEFKKDNN